MIEEERRRDLDFLPEAMVNEMLQKQTSVIEQVGTRIKEFSKIKEKIRQKLIETNLLKNFAEEVHQISYPTTVGVDGTRSIIRQLSLDTAAVASVAVEGLVPPKETRLWEKPHHLLNIYLLKHSLSTDPMLRHIMFSYELELACKAPHMVVFLDGSFTSFLVGIGQGLYLKNKGEKAIQEAIKERENQTLNNFLTVLISPRVDQFFIAIPKYTSRNEVNIKLKETGFQNTLLDEVDDKGLLSMVLRTQEYAGPLKLTRPEDRWHLTGVSENFAELRGKILEAMNNLHIFYFKPSPIHPALRVEIASSIAEDDRKLKTIIMALVNQTAVSGIIEPYPLHIADLFVRHVHGSLLELREAAIAEMGKVKELNLPDFYLSLHDYRSESGFE